MGLALAECVRMTHSEIRMRVSEAALALITRNNSLGQIEFLTQWNAKWQAYSLIGGHRERGESFLDCCHREVEEELGLVPYVDFTAAKDPTFPVLEFQAFSRSAQQETAYQIELFQIDLTSANAREAIQKNPANRWLLKSEVHNRLAGDGRAVADQVFLVLNAAQLLRDDSGILAVNSHSFPSPTVSWIADARRDLGDELCRQLDRELWQVFLEYCPARIIVKQRFRGFSDVPEKKLILAVEVQSAQGIHANVVKIGDLAEVKGDHDGWQSCAARRGVVSRMLIAPIFRSVSEMRAAIIYPDLYQYYLNDGREDEPKELEAIVEQSMLWNSPSSSSVERVLTQVFTEANRCLYRDAQEYSCGELIFKAISKPLRYGVTNSVLDRWRQQEFLQLRRDAVWLTCGHRKPESLARPEYVDPVDFVEWAILQKRFPRMLIGPAHGDLHGRNVLAGVVRGEAEWPAVFDFDRMANDNLVAWDFAKLEIELKCRVLQQLLDTAEEQIALRQQLAMPVKRPLPEDIVLSPDELSVQRRVDRMEIIFAIENRLNGWTKLITNAGQAEKADVIFQPEVSPDTPLGRALRILLRIRREAALCLGFERQGRGALWADEYHFALAVYGVVSAKWHSANDHLAWALLSAGVAVANLTQLPEIRQLDSSPSAEESPSYLHLLPYAAKCWAAEQWTLPLPSLTAGWKKFPYAIPLRQQLALLRAQSSNETEIEQARREIEEIAQLACLFRDHETLCRLGRFYKDRADRQYQTNLTYAEVIAGAHPAFQYYQSSFKLYNRAFQISGDYYPAINAATLALLIGRHDRKTELARLTLALCRSAALEKEDRAWVLATEGEASLLLGRTAHAVEFYRSAFDAILPHETGVMQSIYNQLCRLHWAIGPEVVQPVIEMLDKAGRLRALRPGPFRNCGRVMQSNGSDSQQ
jgi:tetratricopeptide (TPR) repeat protein